MWHTIVVGMQAIISFFYDLTVNMGIPSYALAITLFTLLVKIVLYPLFYKQVKSMAKTSEVQPEVKAIQERYKGNPEKANKEVMDLYKRRGVSPMSGCLPLLIQMPIIIALFQALRDFQYSDVGAGLLWIPHLKNPDPYYVIPLLVAATTYLQTKYSTSSNASADNPAMATTNKMMLYFMPIFIGFISKDFPAGLGIYWTLYSVFGTLQQLYINRKIAKAKGDIVKNEKP